MEDLPIFPNMYVIFVGPPASGKSLPATKTTEVLQSLKTIELNADSEPIERQLVKFSPDSTTLESLYESIEESKEQLFFKIPDKPPILLWHCSISFLIGEEMATLFTDNDIKNLIPFMTQGWSCGSFHRKTRHNGQVRIPNMCINFLGCCTAKWLGDTIRNYPIMQQGFTSRAIVLYSPEPITPVTIELDDNQRQALADVKNHLRKIIKLKGQVKFSDKVKAYFDAWVKDNFKVHKNADKKLEDYYGRKPLHIKKVALAAHFGEVELDIKESFDDKGNFKGDPKVMELTTDDIDIAIKLLEEAEMDMHRALNSGSAVNPVYNLAQRIEEGLRSKGSLTHTNVLVNYFDGGNEEEIMQAISYLKNIGRISQSNGDKVTSYQYLKPA